MKKNILTLMFVLAFVFVGASVVSAKTPNLSSNPVKLSKDSKLNLVKLKLKAILEKGCAKSKDCEVLLDNLHYNHLKWVRCVLLHDYDGCYVEENNMVRAGDNYNNCVDPVNYPLVVKNVRKNRFIKRPDRNG